MAPNPSHAFSNGGRRGAAGPSAFLVAVMLLFWLGMAVPSPARGEVAVIPVDYARVEDLMPAVEMLLSDTGKTSFDRRTHSLVVVDTPAAIAEIRSLLKKFDRPVPRILLRVRFEEAENHTGGEISASGRIGGRGGSVGTPGASANRIDATVSASDRSGRTVSEQVLRVASGSAAFLTVGRDIPFERWRTVCNRHGACRNVSEFQRIETGFEVIPSVRGERIHLRITPRLGAVAAGPAGSARFVEAATEISVAPGRWVEVGGLVAEGNEVVSQILGRGRASSGRAITIRLKAETEP